jgi:hypothetical protein
MTKSRLAHQLHWNFDITYPAITDSQENPTMKRSDEMIDMLVSSVRDDTSERDKTVLRRVLCELVRVAQAESVQSIEADFRAVDMAVSTKYRQ